MRVGLGAVLLLAIAGCGEGDEVVKRSGEPDYVRVKAGSDKMEVAIRQARETVQTFLGALQSPLPGMSSFSVKKKFAVGKDGGEHIWLSDVSWDPERKLIRGTVNNEPVDTKEVKLGDAATVAPAELSDWMFVQDGKLVGGYTIRAHYNLSTSAGRKRFQAETGLKPD
jgi:uncharacterized protein YegJ (DUF2314 family)